MEVLDPSSVEAGGEALLDPQLFPIAGRRGRPPKVLVVATVAATLRGFLLPYAQQLRSKGWVVHGMASGASSSKACLAGFDRCWEAQWTRNPLGLRGLLRAPRMIRELVQREGYDLVHVHTPVAAFLTRWALRHLRPARLKVIYTAHGFHFHRGGSWLRNQIFRRLEQLAARWTDYLVVINEEDQEAARRHELVPEGRLLRMPGIGVEVRSYAASAMDLGAHDSICRELGISSRSHLVTMVAEFTKNKRHRDLIAAAAALGRKDLHLLLAGDGPQRRQCEALARRLGLLDRTHFLGVRSDVGRLLAASELSVLPSAREGMPRVVMESLCIGVPVVGTDVRGTRELLSSGAGTVVPVGDVGALAQAIEQLLDRQGLRRRMGIRGVEVIAAYDLQHTLALNASLYAAAIRGEALADEEVVIPSVLAAPPNLAIPSRIRKQMRAPEHEPPRAG